MNYRQLSFSLCLLLVGTSACVSPSTSPISATSISATTATLPATTKEPTPASSTLLTIDDLLSRCPTADEVAVIDADIRLTFGDGLGPGEPTHTPPPDGRHGPFGPLICEADLGSADLDEVQARIYQALIIMQHLQFEIPLPWTDKPLYEWFVSTVKGVDTDPIFEYSRCCNPDGVIAIGRFSLPAAKMAARWIDPQLTRSYYLPTSDARVQLTGEGMYPLVVLLVHAARYHEVGWYTCMRGSPGTSPVQQTNAWGDDWTLAELGAWGVEHFFLKWLAEHTDRAFFSASGSDPDLYRKIARADAERILATRFCIDTGTPVGR